jgi:branched-chain amino acid transport system permease protein
MRLRRFVPGLVATLAVAAVLAVLPFVMSDYHQLEGARVGIYFIAILGLNILTGYTGQLSLGHGAFMLIGGYTTAILAADHGWNLIATLPLAGLVAFGAGVIVGIPALRLSGVYLALVTFGLAVSLPAFLKTFDGFTGGSGGILLPFQTGRWLYVVTWSSAAILFVLGWLVLLGRIGRAFRAIRDSEVAAVSSGVNLAIYKTLAFGISAAFAGVAGALLALSANGAFPGTFPILLSLEILIGAAVGGLGSLSGVGVGALFLYLLKTHAADISDQAPDMIFGLVLIVVMIVLPAGFAGLLRLVARRRSPAA